LVFITIGSSPDAKLRMTKGFHASASTSHNAAALANRAISGGDLYLPRAGTDPVAGQRAKRQFVREGARRLRNDRRDCEPPLSALIGIRRDVQWIAKFKRMKKWKTPSDFVAGDSFTGPCPRIRARMMAPKGAAATILGLVGRFKPTFPRWILVGRCCTLPMTNAQPLDRSIKDFPAPASTPSRLGTSNLLPTRSAAQTFLSGIPDK
jgi:hypothetical protein